MSSPKLQWLLERLDACAPADDSELEAALERVQPLLEIRRSLRRGTGMFLGLAVNAEYTETPISRLSGSSSRPAPKSCGSPSARAREP